MSYLCLTSLRSLVRPAELPVLPPVGALAVTAAAKYKDKIIEALVKTTVLPCCM